MKKLIIGVILLGSIFGVRAQSNPFPSVDSLVKFTNKKVRNSAVDAFTNLNLNTVLQGLARFSDSALRARGLDTIARQPGKDSIIFTIHGVRYAIKDSVGGGGSVTLDSSRKATQFAIKSSPTDSVIIPQADSLSRAGAYPVTDRKKAQRNEYLLSYAEMRALTNPSTGVFYHTKINNFYCDFYWDATSTVTDDSVMYIKLASVTTGRMVRSYGNFILADWFGLAGDGTTDDSRLAQKAIDFTLSSNSHATWLQFLGKKYAVKNLLIYKDENHDGQYDFVTIRISGPARTLDTGLGLGATTIFKTTDGSAFTMGCMLGRNILIENIIGEGAGPNSIDAYSTVRWTDADWLMSGTIRNNEKSPHCFFNVDPFHYTVASGDQYPGLSAYYTNTSGSGTSQLTFDGCSARSYAVVVGASINGGTSNGDNIVWKNGSQYANRTFWAAGQTQSRANAIENLYSFGGCQTLINCNEYGNHQGTPPNLLNSNIAGALKYVYQINGQFSGLTVSKTYMESLYSLGVSGGMPVTFDNCHILFSRPEVENTFCSPILAEGSTLNFTDGSIEWFDGIGAAGFGFAVDQLNFKGTLIRGGVPIMQSYKQGNVHFDGVHYVDNGGTSYLWESNHNFETNESVIIGSKIIPGMSFRTQNGFDYTGKFNYESIDNKVDIIALETKTIKIDTFTHLAYFTTSSPLLYQLSDMIVSGPINDTTDIYTTAGTTLGFVYAIHSDTIFLKNVPYGAHEGVSYGMSVYRIPTMGGRTIGDVTSGSDTIRNLQYSSSTFNVGMKIKGAGIPRNSFVLYVNTTTNKMRISQPATATATSVELYDARLRMKSVGGYAGVYFKGDEILTEGTSSTVYKYVCTTAGVAGGSPAAVFDTVRYGAGGPGGGGTDTADIAAHGININIVGGKRVFSADTATLYPEVRATVTGVATPALSAVTAVGNTTPVRINAGDGDFSDPASTHGLSFFGQSTASGVLNFPFFGWSSNATSGTGYILSSSPSGWYNHFGGRWLYGASYSGSDYIGETDAGMDIDIAQGSSITKKAIGTFDAVPLYLFTNNTKRISIAGTGNVGIGTSSPGASALLDVSSTTKGVLLPRMTTTQRDAISSPATSLLIFNTTTGTFQFYTGSVWQDMDSGGGIDSTTADRIARRAIGDSLAAGLTVANVGSAGENAGYAGHDSVILKKDYGPLSVQITTNTDSSKTFKLVNDSSTGTAADQYYKTNSTGRKGWYAGPTSGTYTPTVSGISNVASSTPALCHYMRIGNEVTVEGRIAYTATASSTFTSLSISLPIASTIAANEDLSGSGSDIGGTTGGAVRMFGDTVNHNATLGFVSSTTSASTVFFHFTYTIN